MLHDRDRTIIRPPDSASLRRRRICYTRCNATSCYALLVCRSPLRARAKPTP